MSTNWCCKCALAWLGLLGAAQAANIQVEVEGLSGAIADNVRLHLGLVRYADIPDLTETNIRSLHARAPAEVRAALQAFGYYQPRVTSSLERSDDGWLARYLVTPGDPVRLTEIDIRLAGPGEDDPALRGIVQAPGIATGEILQHASYESVKQELRASALENGYRDARYDTSRLEVDPMALSARVVLHLETGIRYRFGSLKFEQRILRNEFMRRYPTFKPGDPFSARQLLDLQYALYDSEYFSHVEVETQEPEEDRVPVVVRADARKKNRYSLGVGYATDTRARINLGWTNRRLNRRGHRSKLDLTLSSIKQQLVAQYIVPLERPQTDRIVYAARVTDEELGDTDSSKNETSVTQIRRLGTWQRQIYTRLAREQTTIGDDTNSSTLLIPGTTWSRTRSNDPIFPTTGSFLKLDVHGSADTLASDTSFLQVRLDTRWVHPFRQRDRLLARATIGTTTGDEFGLLPASERFFAGGDTSVRGFSLNSLGPRDADGNVVGGKHLLTGSLEYELRIRGPWAVAFFADGGNASDSFGDELEYSLGVGMRWQSRIGMLRVDLAEPISRGNDSIRLHFNFGPEL